MTKLYVLGPHKFNFLRGVLIGLGFVGAYYTVGQYNRKEFMRRVRARNELMRLDVATIKEIVDVDLRTADGSPLRFDQLVGEYLCIYSGAFKDFTKFHRALTESQYGQELSFLFVADQEKLQKLTKDAVRVPLANS